MQGRVSTITDEPIPESEEPVPGLLDKAARPRPNQLGDSTTVTGDKPVRRRKRAPRSAQMPSGIKAMIEDAVIEPGGAVLVSGWTAGAPGIEQIAVFLDDRLLGLAEGQLPRPDLRHSSRLLRF